MSLSNSEPVTIQILGREYKLRCNPEERDRLLSAADRLDTEMRTIRAGGTTLGPDRIAIMAALNIAHELVQLQTNHAELQRRLCQRIGHLNELVDSVLTEGKTIDSEDTGTSDSVLAKAR